MRASSRPGGRDDRDAPIRDLPKLVSGGASMIGFASTSTRLTPSAYTARTPDRASRPAHATAFTLRSDLPVTVESLAMPSAWPGALKRSWPRDARTEVRGERLPSIPLWNGVFEHYDRLATRFGSSLGVSTGSPRSAMTSGLSSADPRSNCAPSWTRSRAAGRKLCGATWTVLKGRITSAVEGPLGHVIEVSTPASSGSGRRETQNDVSPSLRNLRQRLTLTKSDNLSGLARWF